MSDITNIPQNTPEQQSQQQSVQQNQNNATQTSSYKAQQQPVQAKHSNIPAKNAPVQRSNSSIKSPSQLNPSGGGLSEEAKKIRDEIPLPAYGGSDITKEEKEDPEKYRQRNFEYISTTMDRLVPYLKWTVKNGKPLKDSDKINEKLNEWHGKARKKSWFTTTFTRNSKLIEKQREVTEGVDQEIGKIKEAAGDEKGLSEVIKEEFDKIKEYKGHINNASNGLVHYNDNKARQVYANNDKDKAGGQYSIEASLAELTMSSDAALKYLHKQFTGKEDYKDKEAFIQIGRLLARPDVKQMAVDYQHTYGTALTKAIETKFGAPTYENKMGARSKYLLDMIDSPGKTPVSARLAISLGLLKRDDGFFAWFVSDEEEIVRLFETVNPKDLDKIWTEFKPLMKSRLNPHNYQRIKSFYNASRLYADNAKDNASAVKDGAKDFDDIEKKVAKKVYVNFFKKLGVDDQKEVLEAAQGRLSYDDQALFNKEPLKSLPDDLKLTEVIGKLTVNDRATVKANITAKLKEEDKKAMLKEEELTTEETLIETATKDWEGLSEDDQKKKLEDQAIKEKWNSLGKNERKKYAGEYDKNKSWDELSAEQKASYKAENPVALPEKEQWKDQFLKNKKDSLKNYQEKRTALAKWQETALENGLYLEHKDRQLAAIVENLINGSGSVLGYFWVSPTVDGDAVVKAVDGWVKGAMAEETAYFNGEPVIRRYVMGEKNEFSPLGTGNTIKLENKNKHFLNRIDESTMRSAKLGWNITHRNDMRASVSRGLDERLPADDTGAKKPTEGDAGRKVQIEAKMKGGVIGEMKESLLGGRGTELISQIQKVIRKRGKELDSGALATLKMMAREARLVDMTLSRNRRQDVVSAFGGLSSEAILQLLNVFLSDTKETIEKSGSVDQVEANVNKAIDNIRNALIVLKMEPKQIFEITGKLKYGTHVGATYLELRRYAGMDSDWGWFGREHFDGEKLLVLANKLSEKELAVAKSDAELHIGLERQFGKYYFSAWRDGRRIEGEKLFKQVYNRLGFTPQNNWESKTRISKEDYQNLSKATSSNKEKREKTQKADGDYINYYWGLVKKDAKKDDISNIEAEITRLKDQDKTVEIEALERRVKNNYIMLNLPNAIAKQQEKKKRNESEEQDLKNELEILKNKNKDINQQLNPSVFQRLFGKKVDHVALEKEIVENQTEINELSKKIDTLKVDSERINDIIKNKNLELSQNKVSDDDRKRENQDAKKRIKVLKTLQEENKKKIAKLTSDKETLDGQEKTRNKEVDEKQNGLKKQEAGFNNLKEIETLEETAYKAKVDEWAKRWSETIANTGEERKMLHLAMLIWQAGDAVVAKELEHGSNPYLKDAPFSLQGNAKGKVEDEAFLKDNRRNIFLYEVYKALKTNHPEEAKKLAANTADMTTLPTVAGGITVPAVVGGVYLINKGIRHAVDRNMHFVEKLKAGEVDVIDEILRSNYRAWRPTNDKDQMFVKQAFDKLSGRVLLEAWTDVAGHEAILKERKDKKAEIDKKTKAGENVTQLQAEHDILDKEIRHHRIPLPSSQRLEQLKQSFTNDKVYLDTVEALFTRLAKAAKDEPSFTQAMKEKGYLPSDWMILGETYEAIATQEREKFMSGGWWTPQWGLLTVKGMERQEANVELVSKFRNLSAASDQGKTREEMSEQIDAFGTIKDEVGSRTESFIKAAETYRANIKTFITLVISLSALPFGGGAIGAWWAMAAIKAALAAATTAIDHALSHEQSSLGRIFGESALSALKSAISSATTFGIYGISFDKYDPTVEKWEGLLGRIDFKDTNGDATFGGNLASALLAGSVSGVAGKITGAMEDFYRKGFTEMKKGMGDSITNLAFVFPVEVLKGAMIAAVFQKEKGQDSNGKEQGGVLGDFKGLFTDAIIKSGADVVDTANATQQDKDAYGTIGKVLWGEITSKIQDITGINLLMKEWGNYVKPRKSEFSHKALKDDKTTHLDDMKALQDALDKINLLILGEDVGDIESTLKGVDGVPQVGELIEKIKGFVAFVEKHYPKDKKDLLGVLKKCSSIEDIQTKVAENIKNYMADPKNNSLKPKEEEKKDDSSKQSILSGAKSNVSNPQSNLSNQSNNLPNPVKQLPIQVQTQINPKSCWAACLSMLLSKYGINKTQQDLIGSFTDGANGLDLGAMHSEWGNQTFKGNLTSNLLREFGNPKKAHISFGDIKQSIDAGNPILIGVQNNEYKAHALIITGYDETTNNVYLIDPYVQGTVKTVAYADLAGTGIDLLLGKKFLWVETLKFTVPNP